MPIAAPILFYGSALYCLVILHSSVKTSNLTNARKLAFKTTGLLISWILLQLALTEYQIYSSDMQALPPKIVLYGVLPVVAVIILIFNNKKSQLYIDSMPMTRITAIHMVRIIVEIGLYYVYIGKGIPEIMTFRGQNFDILAGLTAPLIIYFGLVQKKLSRIFILMWNFLSLGLLLYIIVLAFLAAPSPMQQIAFYQPNIAIFEVPYSLLPTFIVPVVIFMHLVAIRQLIRKQDA